MARMLLALCASSVVLFSACTERDGPAERAGERIDDTISGVRDRAEQAGEEAIDRIDAAGDEIRDAAEGVGDALRGE